MKIFLIARGCPATGDPQWGCFELDQAKALVKQGHQVVVLYVDGRFRLSNLKQVGIRRHKIEDIEYIGLYLYPAKLLGWLGPKNRTDIRSRQLTVVYKRAVRLFGKPDVIYAHYMFNIAYAVRLKEKYGVRLVGIEHWSRLNKPVMTKRVRYMGEKAYNGADLLIAVSDSLRHKIWEHFGKEATVVHNMAGQEFFTQPIGPLSVQPHPVRLVAIGSLIPRKGYDLLIEALSKLPENSPEWELNIIGDGPEREKLSKQVTGYRLSAKVHFLGKKCKEDIVRILRQSDAFVLASRAETFGVVYIEAMSQGLPVVATLCGGPEEFVHRGNGVLVPTEDVPQLTEALKQMIAHAGDYDRKSIAEECRQKFSPEVISRRLSELLSGGGGNSLLKKIANINDYDDYLFECARLLKEAESNPKDEEKIDFVLLWVDGGDPAWLKQKNEYSPKKADYSTDDNRFRDWDNLQYWFRGVEKFAPWVNNIYFITWGHLPKWLNTEHPKLKIVKHTDYIPVEYLPTFNSDTIETNLHRLKGLSETFTLFNDDVFLISKTEPSDFFVDGKPCDSFVENLIAISGSGSKIYHTKVCNTNIINSHFNKRRVLRKNWKKIFNQKYGLQNLITLYFLPFPMFVGFRNPHIAYSHLKSTFKTMWDAAGDDLQQSCANRFRGYNDVSHWAMRYWNLCSGNFKPRSPKFGRYFQAGNDNGELCRYITKQNGKVVCINDMSTDIDFDKAKCEINAAFEQILPEKSSFEK